MRIAIVGKMRSGKNLVADILTDKYGFSQLAFADGITEIIKKYFPEAFEDGKPRKHYQHIGQELRVLNPNVWINYLDRAAADLADVIVTDCRQVNEEKYLRANGYMIIKIHADDEVRWQRIAVANEVVTVDQFHHDTEQQVDQIEPDYMILNNGTHEELINAVDAAFNYYKLYFEPDKKYRKLLEESSYEIK